MDHWKICKEELIGQVCGFQGRIIMESGKEGIWQM
jgi:hypothetical protein